MMVRSLSTSPGTRARPVFEAFEEQPSRGGKVDVFDQVVERRAREIEPNSVANLCGRTGLISGSPAISSSKSSPAAPWGVMALLGSASLTQNVGPCGCRAADAGRSAAVDVAHPRSGHVDRRRLGPPSHCWPHALFNPGCGDRSIRHRRRNNRKDPLRSCCSCPARPRRHLGGVSIWTGQKRGCSSESGQSWPLVRSAAPFSFLKGVGSPNWPERPAMIPLRFATALAGGSLWRGSTSSFSSSA